MRTDAVWEKFQLTDWYRNQQKCFFYNKGLRRYQLVEPDDAYNMIWETWALEDVVDFPGFTPTGRSNSFQTGLGPKQRARVSAMQTYSQQDYYMLCGLRFEKWFRCDLIYHDKKATKFEYQKDQTQYKAYPCYREFYEANYACQDDMFDFLMELAYARRANDTWEGDHSNIELQLQPTRYDSPKSA